VSGSDAASVLAEVSHRYSSLAAYSDTGTVVSAVASVAFETAFKRGTYFHFAYSDVLPGRPRQVMARVTWDDGRLDFWTLVNAPAPATLRLAIAALTGISSGSAHTIPALLAPEEVGGWIPTELTDPELAAGELIDGISCLHVRGRHPWFPGKFFSLYVDPSTWLVRRSTAHSGKQVATYMPVMGLEKPEPDSHG
jgi:hypothetical protein